MDRVAVIGGGPAGLRVAQVLSEAGHHVELYEQQRSVGRKFLIAGKSGLNLTNDAEQADFLSVYQGVDFPVKLWKRVYENFDNSALRKWAEALGQKTFVSSGKKVFPEDMKAAPLLRALLKEIKSQGTAVHVNHSLERISPTEGGYSLSFLSPEGMKKEEFSRVMLALGGGSWKKTGSNGKWVSFLSDLAVQVNPLTAANSGWEVEWSADFLLSHEGQPLKNISCMVEDQALMGELIITRYGLEGGPLYRLGHVLRQMANPVLKIDFKPSFSAQDLIKKAESVRRNLKKELPQRWKISDAVVSLLAMQYGEIFQKEKVCGEDVSTLANGLKQLCIPLEKARPIEEAISSAGGVAWSEVDENLMLKKYPNLYVCGEMLDWEAPTGGYLLQGCFSTATWVGRAIQDQVES